MTEKRKLVYPLIALEIEIIKKKTKINETDWTNYKKYFGINYNHIKPIIVALWNTWNS